MKDREDVAAEEMYKARRSLGGYLARVSTVINQVKTSIAEERECEEVREAVRSVVSQLVYDKISVLNSDRLSCFHTLETYLLPVKVD